MARKSSAYEYWQNENGKWNYHLVGKNSEVQSFTNQGYNSEADVKRGIADDRRNSATAEVKRIYRRSKRVDKT